MNIALCCISRNERNLEEWVAYHQAIGVQHFYLYDNADNPELCHKFNSRSITVLHYPGINKQVEAYNDCALKYKHRHEWLGFLDPDEFIAFDVRFSSLPEVLSNAPTDIDALMLNWKMFGYNGHEKAPPGLIIENYTKRQIGPTKINGRAHFERYFKTLLKRDHSYNWTHACHSISGWPLKTYYGDFKEFLYSDELLNDKMYTLRGIQLKSLKASNKVITANDHIIWINHYWTKSLEEFIEKQQSHKRFYLPEFTVTQNAVACATSIGDIINTFSNNHVDDDSSARFADKVKEIMTRV